MLLSQVHRLRALDLLGRFLDLGPWAVSLVRRCHLLSCNVGFISGQGMNTSDLWEEDEEDTPQV